MPDTNSVFNFDGKSAGELEMRRRELVASAKGKYDDLSLDTLKELSALTGALRRKTAGPPKKKVKATKAAKPVKMTTDDIFGGLNVKTPD